MGTDLSKTFRCWVAGLALVLALGVGRTASASAELETVKMQKRFGAGIGLAGPLGTLGIVADFNLAPDFSLMGGLGTGLDYASFMVEGRYFLLGEWVSPYFGLSFGRWWTGRTADNQVSPSLLRNVFLEPGHDYSQGFSVYFVSPAIGVQFMHPMGFAVSLELEYMFKLFNFANGTYGAINVLWYF